MPAPSHGENGSYNGWSAPIEAIMSESPITDDVAPMRRPGFHSRELPVATRDKAQLIASATRVCAGIIGFVIALLFVPPHVVTPILASVSVLMVVSGSHQVWCVGRAEPRLLTITRPLIWSAGLGCLLVIALMLVLGPGVFVSLWLTIPA